MKPKQLILGLVFLAALVTLAVYAQHQHPFDFHAFADQFRQAGWQHIAIGVACIYFAYVLRAIRWAFLIRHVKKVPPLSLLGTQVIGFTAVALIGRVADFIRPYLVSRKTGLPISSQIATYIVERLFDAGAMALIFSSVIVFDAPQGSLPHQAAVFKTSLIILALTVCGALFLIELRLAGGRVDRLLKFPLRYASKGLAHSVEAKIHSFRLGLSVLRTPADAAVTLAISLTMWALITLAYLETAWAFRPTSSLLGSMSLAQCVILLGASGGASIFQLPVLGWFTQIGAVAATLVGLGATQEPATACAATLLIVTFLSVAPVGLIWAQFENISLRSMAQESEHAAEVAEVELDNTDPA